MNDQDWNIEMTNEELEIKLTNFLAKISTWMTHYDIIWNPDDQFQKRDIVMNILDGDPKDFRQAEQHHFQEYLFLLNQYLYRINMGLMKERSVMAWAEQGLNFLIVSQEFSQYTKWEEKKFIIIKKSEIGKRLQELKTVAESRIQTGEVMVKRIENSMKIIETIGRNKMYERS